MGRSTFGGLILLGSVLLPAPVAAQTCALDMALGTAIPAGRVPNGLEPDARLSAGWGLGLGLECGPPSIRFGIDLDSYRLYAEDFLFGTAVGVSSLLARLGYRFKFAGDLSGPWVVVAAQAGVARVSRIPGSYVAIGYFGRQLTFDWDVAAGGNLRLGFPVLSRWSVLFDFTVRAHSLSTFDPYSGEMPGLRTLVTVPVRVGVRLTL
ncbi:hypothetical protein [Candidatus Palauibacter sp.]|uniref:hypothetical protein n=1 Tax=Candidatus Palauibacter sp. TaxID=3101350 RepID=UPI003AF22C8E